MRVGIILDKSPGLPETFLAHHVRGLLRAGHEVVVFARPVKTQETHPVVRECVEGVTRYLPHQELGLRQVTSAPGALWRLSWNRRLTACLNPLAYGTGVFRLRALHGLSIVEQERFDLLHCHYAAIGWAFLPYRDAFRVPLVTSFHGDHHPSFPRRREWMLRPLFRRGDAFVANGEYMRNELMRLGCPDEKIQTIPAIVDDDGVVPNQTVLGSNIPHLVTVARLEAAKGIQYALLAVRVLLDRGYRVRYTVGGDGPYRSILIALVGELGLEQSVAFLGGLTHDQVYSLYRSADLFVLPSVRSAEGWEETQGIVIQEAQLHGLPVIASNLGGIPESLDGGRAGFLFPPGDHVALATSIARLLDEPGLARDRSAVAVDYVRRKYTERVVIPRLVTLYQALLDRGRAARSSSLVDQRR